MTAKAENCSFFIICVANSDRVYTLSSVKKNFRHKIHKYASNDPKNLLIIHRAFAPRTK